MRKLDIARRVTSMVSRQQRLEELSMSSADLIVGLVVATALCFDFTNGFHDTANAIATTIATGALPPRIAVAMAAMLNFVGAFISLRVAATIAGGIVEAGAITPTVIFGGLIGAISWNLATWWFGLPSSSSHALIGGVIGATLAAAGTSAVKFEGLLSNVLIPAVASPIVAGLVAATGVYVVYRMIRGFHPDRSEREFRWGQVASSSMVALAHGTNDAQKTMGVISLALIANGSISGGAGFRVPEWVVICCATTIALGTYAGGWRIIKTLGTKVVEVRPPQGFGSETVAASVILVSSHVGYPLSTTQVVSGAVTGSGVGRPGAVVNWLVARGIVAGWLLTLPSAAAVSMVVYAIIQVLGGGVGGTVVVSVAMIIAAFLLWRANRAQPVEPEETVTRQPALGPAVRPEAAIA
jgi:PiT family inorganic phosphate transporter